MAAVARDYVRYYDLVRFLVEEVHRRFRQEGSVGAFDLFSIVIWKANRAKSKVARRLLEQDSKKRTVLEPIVRDLTRTLSAARDPKERFQILFGAWKLRLPMASAILSVFWPDEFSLYDVRVCNQLGSFHNMGDKTDVDASWQGYCEYLDAVHGKTPAGLSLRDKDRYLWGKSLAEQLEQDLERGFV